jgi:hypothetical protein
MDPEEEKDEEMAFLNAKREMKAIHGNFGSKSSDNECRKALHVMFVGSWDITSWRIIKTLHREVTVAALAPKAAVHHKWMEMSISFDASNCPKSMAGAWQLPLIFSPAITNIKVYHVLISGHAALNLNSLKAFRKLQIPLSKLQPSRPFFGVGLVSVMPRGCISPLSYSGHLRTSAHRASSSTSRRSTSPLTSF